MSIKPFNNHWPGITFFTCSEFDSPDLLGTGELMNYLFVWQLDKLRFALKRTIIIKSGYRTPKHNASVKGSYNSAHLRGLATDIHIPNNRYRYDIIKYCMFHNFPRIFIYKKHIHVDFDYSLPYPVFGWMKDV
jgi:hypothetical protein